MGTKKTKKHRVASPTIQGIGRPMRDGEKYPYAIFRHNLRTLEGSTKVAVVMGQTRASQAVNYHDSKLTRDERDSGWSHYAMRTTGRLWNEVLETRTNAKPEMFRKL
jgi:hypothetical protein